MKKIPTLFERVFENHKKVGILPNVTPGMEWVLEDVPRSFEGIRDYLQEHYIEGIVFWRNGEPRCKIKRSDFGFKWNEAKV